MHSGKNIFSLRIRQTLTRILMLLLLAGLSAGPAYAAVNPELSDSRSALADEKRLAQIPADTSASTWKKVGGNIRLKGSNGKYKTGFVKKGGKYYYFDSKGNLKTGFFTVKGKTWFASYVKGAMGKGQILTGIVYVKGLYYYMNPASSPCPGAVSTGFQKINGMRFYFNQRGRMVTGWFKVGTSTYYASCNKKKHYGALLTGIQKIGQKTYRFDSNGRLIGAVAAAPKPAPSRSLAAFPVIGQHPELPTGCEATALTMVLNYYGFPADKMDIAVNYLPKGPIGSTDFRKAFLGDPRNSWSRGCYAPAANIPVLFWGTINCLSPYNGVTWRVNGKKLTWIGQEHCLVLLGFPNGKVKVADPYSGSIRLYDLNIFRSRYNALHKQGVIIK